MTQDNVRAALKPYPNLEAILIGCVSGQVTEWPMIRGELVRLVSVMRDELAQVNALYKDSCSALNAHMDVYTETVNALKQAKARIAELEG